MEMTYISQTGSTGDAGDQYTGLDRFGRVVEQNWYNTSSSSSTDDFQYGYDQDWNVLYKNNIIDSIFSELYHASGSGNGYDNLNQLSAFATGTLSASGGSGTPLDTVSSPTETKSWSPDALGNFSSVTLNGTQTNRTNNQQNEATAVGSSSLTFDPNGNTTTDNQGLTYTYDAWNRMISVKSSGTTIASYAYDGLGRRIQQAESGTTTDIYFDANWRDVEEQVSGVTQTRYVWSSIDQDALVLRDDTPSGGVLTRRIWVQQDANWNVTSIANTSGSVVERYVYDPYGAVTYLSSSWGSLSASAYAMQYLFQVGRLDAQSGLYIFQHRDYSPTLGRRMEVDPLRYSAGDNNLYRLVSDNPISRVDPNGETFTVALPLAGRLAGIAVGAAASFPIVVGTILLKPAWMLGELIGEGIWQSGVGDAVFIYSVAYHAVTYRPGQKPIDAPPGTRSIDEHLETKKNVHAIKKGLAEEGVGPASYVGIAPDGSIIVTNPDGTHEVVGHVNEYP
jgi:RHS repeat-associated protein